MKHTRGDLFAEIKKTTGKVFVMHQVNCQNVMGAGFAKAFYQHYPEIKHAFHAYANILPTPEDRFGKLQYVDISNQLVCVNSYTQLSFGSNEKQTDEQRLIDNIITVASVAKAQGAELFIPAYIGCGLAGGDWPTVYNGIEHLDLTLCYK